MKYRYSSVKRTIEALLFVAVLALGWRYPCLAYCLLLNVAVGLIGALRHGGRHGCGNFCPRGAFYSLLPDTGRKVPAGLLQRKAHIFLVVVHCQRNVSMSVCMSVRRYSMTGASES